MCDPIGAVGDIVEGTVDTVEGVGKWVGGIPDALGDAGEILIKGTGDVLKDISGASAAEDANALAREQMNEEQAARLQAREDAKTQTATEQMRASRSAGASRTSAATGGTSLTAATIGEDERDFLGL